ncbi:kinase-like protein, partial [Ramaria rubella]
YSRLQNVLGTPRLLWYGWTSEGFIMVFQGLRANLGKIMATCPFFGITPDLCYLAVEMISQIQSVHAAGLVHGDIKPENFTLGVIHCDKILVCILDFGSAFPHTEDGKHIKDLPVKESLAGTIAYCSLRFHQRLQLSHRDNIESLAYTLLDIHIPGLPWWDRKTKKELNGAELSEDLAYAEKTKFLENEDYGFVYPAFMAMIKYSRTLAFDEPPDYEMLQAMCIPLEES